MASLRRKKEQDQYRAYIADGLFAITNNLSLNEKYTDLKAKQKKAAEPQKSAAEIVQNFRAKFAG